MRKCEDCGKRMRRVHRTLWERFNYLAVFECRECDKEYYFPRTHMMHLGKFARCPKCGTFRISRLRDLDPIDPMRKGIYNLMEKMAGGQLFHCRFCRIQFYDRRRTRTEVSADERQVGAEAAASANDGPDA